MMRRSPATNILLLRAEGRPGFILLKFSLLESGSELTPYISWATDACRFLPTLILSQDVEPEYIAVTENGNTAYVSLQASGNPNIVETDADTAKRHLPVILRVNFVLYCCT